MMSSPEGIYPPALVSLGMGRGEAEGVCTAALVGVMGWQAWIARGDHAEGVQAAAQFGMRSCRGRREQVEQEENETKHRASPFQGQS